MHAMTRSDLFRLVFHGFSACPGRLAAVFAACAAFAAPGEDVPDPATPEDGAKAAPVDALVARVNGETVTISDVMREIPAALAAARKRPDAPGDEEALFRSAFRECSTPEYSSI